MSKRTNAGVGHRRARWLHEAGCSIATIQHALPGLAPSSIRQIVSRTKIGSPPTRGQLQRARSHRMESSRRLREGAAWLVEQTGITEAQANRATGGTRQDYNALRSGLYQTGGAEIVPRPPLSVIAAVIESLCCDKLTADENVRAAALTLAHRIGQQIAAERGTADNTAQEAQPE